VCLTVCQCSSPDGRSSPDMALSSWRENFSSGVSFIRRRFSSNDLQSDDERLATGDVGSADTTGLNFNLPRGQRGRSRPSPSAPSSPSKSSSSGYGAFARGLFSTSSSGQRPAYNKDRCKTLLVIDEPHVDWSVSHTLHTLSLLRAVINFSCLSL